MNKIILTVEDADYILSYIREQLEAEDETWNDYLKDVEKIKKENKVLYPGLEKAANEIIDDAHKINEERHNIKVKRLTEFVELLTSGSEE